MRRIALFGSLLLPLASVACAPNGPPAGLADTAPVPPVAQQASPVAAADASASPAGPSCLANPNYARKPVDGRSGSTVAWVARPDGRGCMWQRTRS